MGVAMMFIYNLMPQWKAKILIPNIGENKFGCDVMGKDIPKSDKLKFVYMSHISWIIKIN